MAPPTVAGRSCLCISEDKLVNSLSNSGEFRTWVGAANDSEAREHIFVGEMPSPQSQLQDEYGDAEFRSLFPMAFIFEDGDDEGVVFEQESDSNGYGVGDVFLSILFQNYRDDQLSNSDDHRAFKDAVQMIWKEILSQSDLPDRFAVKQSSHSPVWIEDPEEAVANQRRSCLVKVAYVSE